MTTPNALGFQLPDDFDVAAYDGVHRLAGIISAPNDAANPAKRNAWLGYSTAWTGVAVRLRAALEYSCEFGESISRSTAPPHEERYRQERALYGCLSSALSSVECAFMATYCLCSVLALDQMPLSSAKHLNQTPMDVARAFGKWANGDPFSAKLLAIVSSPEMQALADFRNTLAHRGVLPRHHRLSNAVALPSLLPSNPKALAVDFDYKMNMSPNTTASHASWASRTCSDIAIDLYAFLSARLPG